jgi:thioredoxin 1
VTVPVAELTEDGFSQLVLKSETPVLVEFWGSWCTACKAMFPHLDKLNEEHGSKLGVTKLNVEVAPDLAVAYGISSIPAMLVFKDGEVVHTINGSRTYEKLTDELLEFL